MTFRLLFLFIGLFSIGLGKADASESRFEKDGFVLDHHSNGGNCTGCEWLVIEGPIPADAGKVFRTWMIEKKLAGTPYFINLNSPGGSLIGGIQLGRAIREFNLRASVGKSRRMSADSYFHDTEPGICASACAYAFLGGRQRLAKAGEVGVHQFYQDAFMKRPLDKEFSALDLSRQQILSGLLLDYIVEMGADPQIAIEASKVLPDQMKFFNEEELKRLRVSFEPDRYGSWTIEPYRDGLVASSKTPDMRKQMTLLCTKSGGLDLIQTYRGLDPTANLLEAFNAINVFMINDVPVARSAIKASEKPDRTELSLRMSIPKEALDVIRTGKKGLAFEASMDEPRAFRESFVEEAPREGLAAITRLTARNCIR